MATDDERWRRILWDVASFCGPHESLLVDQNSGLDAEEGLLRSTVTYLYSEGAGLAADVPIRRLSTSRGWVVRVGDAPARSRRRRRYRSPAEPSIMRQAALARATPGVVYGWCREALAPELARQRAVQAEKARADILKREFWATIGYRLQPPTYRADTRLFIPNYDACARIDPGTGPMVRVTMSWEWLPLAQVQQLCEWLGVPRYEAPGSTRPPGRIVELPDEEEATL